MTPPVTIKPTHKTIQAYYQRLQAIADLNQTHETAVRTAFIRLLEDTARLHGWSLVTEVGQKTHGHTVIPDATLYKSAVPRGYYEAKDADDDLDAEIRKKAARGYPLTNIIFEDTQRAVLYQGKREVYRVEDMKNPDQLAHLLNTFFSYTEPVLEDYDQALDEFREQVPQLARGLVDIITKAHRSNRTFQAAFNDFFELCKNSLNPNISVAAVDEMLVQHLLTERLIRRIFDNPEFTARNVIAVEIEKVIRALASQSFSRDEFLRGLDTFYQAIEHAAHELEFSQKQTLLNEVYERFFQGYSIKIADTHGIVYTPQPIVDFMCASVVEALQTEFGKTLGDDDVVILDPCTGTGNFIVNLLRRADKADLPDLYANRLFANEIMLLPYYIAALNVEHAYYELTGKYESFEGLCFVDTLDIAEGAQMRMSFMTEQNSARVERQKKAPITVIIGNPPYNMNQHNENDNNKNRKYEVIDKRIHDTYATDSKATNKNALSDAYVKFFRWASDRLQGRDGIVCYVSNNGFIDQLAFDGMRKHLAQEFSCIYVLDLKGNVRQDSMREGIPIGEANTVFGLAAMVGISITILVRNSHHTEHKINHYAVDWKSTRIEKFTLLNKVQSVEKITWTSLTPDAKNTWLIPENADEFATFIPLGTKEAKASKSIDPGAIFKLYSGGVKTNRDDVVYDFDRQKLTERIQQFVEDYNGEVDRYKRLGNSNVDDFVKYDRIKWSRDLKLDLQRQHYAQFKTSQIRTSLYRPFSKKMLFFDRILNEEVYVMPQIFPTPECERENQLICCTNHSQIPFSVQITYQVPSLDVGGRPTQCFPYFVYDEDGSNRRENITDWALAQFREHYGDPTIGKWDIFYYVYGILHHPGYRARFADNLKRELPRIPFAPAVEVLTQALTQEALTLSVSTRHPSPIGEGLQESTDLHPSPAGEGSGVRANPASASGFWAFANAGRQLADIHLRYEEQPIYRLKKETAKDIPLSYRVEKMRLNKEKTALKVNDSLTLSGIPPEVFAYKLGNRSALDWVIDQYQVTTDKRSGITSDPNRDDDEQYIVNLVGRVITVSLETVKIVKGLPEQFSQAG